MHVSGYRFLLRRLERALVGRDIAANAVRTPAQALATGAVLAVVMIAVCAGLAVLRPQASLGDGPILMGQQSGALYVRVGDIVHPVLNLASARLVTATAGNPQPVSESVLSHTKRGPVMGIPGAPQFLAPPLPTDQTSWTVCDDHDGTTIIVGSAQTAAHRLSATQTVLVTPDAGASTYLLYAGRRAVVDLADPAVVRALRLEGIVPQSVSHTLLNVIPEAPAIAVPPIPRGGQSGPVAGFAVGSVLRIARAGGDELYVVLSSGIQRIGQVAADLLRLTDAHGARTIISVAPDLLRGIATVNELPVATFPFASTPVAADTTLCVRWAIAASGGVEISFGTGGLPVPPGETPVVLSQADGAGPAVDAVHLPPGRSAYVRSTALSGDNAESGTRYLVTDTGVRFAVHDADAERNLGLPQTLIPAPWPVLATLPSGPELSRKSASVARDTVGGRSPGTP